MNNETDGGILFVCGTEYQLLIAFALSVTVYAERKKTLMIYGNNRLYGTYRAAKELKIWDTVELIDESDESSLANSEILNLVSSADILHFFSWGFPAYNKIFREMANKGKKIILTDEGTLTYSPKRLFESWISVDERRREQVKEFDFKDISEIWVCEPGMFAEPRDVPIVQISMPEFIKALKSNRTLAHDLARLFSWKKSDLVRDKDVVYFRQYLSQSGDLHSYLDRLIDNVVCALFKDNNIYIRDHPAVAEISSKKREGKQNPWELNLIFSEVFEETSSQAGTVYVSLTSSAMHNTVFTGKGAAYFYLYRIIGNYNGSDSKTIDSIVDNVRRTAPNAQIFIPNDWAEFYSNLRLISSELGHEFDFSAIPNDEKALKAVEQEIESLEEKENESMWGVPKWLLARQPTPARIAALKAIMAANPEIGTLGVAIIDTVGAAAVEVTLESVRTQHRQPDSIWVVSTTDVGEIDEAEWIIAIDSWPLALNARIAKGAPDYLLVVFAGDILLPQALLLMGEHRLNHPTSLAWYIDEDVLEEGLPAKPILKPDFNLDLLRSYPYIGRTLAFSTAAGHELGGLDTAFGDLSLIDLVWRLVERAGPVAIGHIPEVLVHSARSLFGWVEEADTDRLSRDAVRAHLARMSVTAEVAPAGQRGLQCIRYLLQEEPLVSIIVPTRDQLPVLRNCVESLMEHTIYSRYELLIVDNGSIEPEACEFLSQLETMGVEQVRVLRWPHPFNFSGINNFAAEHARGEVLLFLNNDIQVTNKNWLSIMLGHALRPEIGIVGSRLDYPDGRVQHGGLILGMDNSVGFAFQGAAGDLQGYMSRLQATHNVSAVSAACLMMRREVFDELGGFDSEAFPVYYGDADLCMRATQAGFLITLVPDTGLKHMGGATRLLNDKFGLTVTPDDVQCERLYAKWLPQLAKDPAYHPAYGKNAPGFDLSRDAARIQTPLPGRPLPVVLASHSDWEGCGNYRIIQPFQALENALCVEGGLKQGNFHFTDVARIEPDVIVLQGAWAHEGILKQIERYREWTGAKVALEFDDYVPNIPVQSAYRKLIPQSVIKQMRRAIEKVDWLVVSTPELAQEYADYHHDIRVAQNGLNPAWWQNLKMERRAGKKLRVGWAGGSSHTGDLAVIRPLVKDLEKEVEWVFMGMQPKDVQCEFHPGVPINQYPQKLASLSLDLAVVPLEINQFNRSKSNLRLLELGVCGVPVICTDIESYRGGLPVTRVRNRYQDWAEAIRSHLSDREALERQGVALRKAVLENWLLEGDFLEQWKEAWLPRR